MATTYTMDASVFLNVFNPYEPSHAHIRRSPTCKSRPCPSSCPPCSCPRSRPPWGVAGTIPTWPGALPARRFAGMLLQRPYLLLIPLDETLAQQAAGVAAQHRLRGSDAVYAAVALRFGSTFVTLDRDQRQRVAPVIPSCLPAGALEDAGS
jgi:hypothetical protein